MSEQISVKRSRKDRGGSESSSSDHDVTGTQKLLVRDFDEHSDSSSAGRSKEDRMKKKKKRGKSEGEDSYFKSIVSRLKSNDKSLEKVDFQGKTACFTQQKLEELCKAYAENKTTMRLDFKYCNLGDDGCKIVCKYILMVGKKQKWLDLSFNDITPVGAEVLLKALNEAQACGIKYIDLRGNKLTKEFYDRAKPYFLETLKDMDEMDLREQMSDKRRDAITEQSRGDDWRLKQEKFMGSENSDTDEGTEEDFGPCLYKEGSEADSPATPSASDDERPLVPRGVGMSWDDSGDFGSCSHLQGKPRGGGKKRAGRGIGLLEGGFGDGRRKRYQDPCVSRSSGSAFPNPRGHWGPERRNEQKNGTGDIVPSKQTDQYRDPRGREGAIVQQKAALHLDGFPERAPTGSMTKMDEKDAGMGVIKVKELREVKKTISSVSREFPRNLGFYIMCKNDLSESNDMCIDGIITPLDRAAFSSAWGGFSSEKSSADLGIGFGFLGSRLRCLKDKIRVEGIDRESTKNDCFHFMEHVSELVLHAVESGGPEGGVVRLEVMKGLDACFDRYGCVSDIVTGQDSAFDVYWAVVYIQLWIYSMQWIRLIEALPEPPLNRQPETYDMLLERYRMETHAKHVTKSLVTALDKEPKMLSVLLEKTSEDFCESVQHVVPLNMATLWSELIRCLDGAGEGTEGEGGGNFQQMCRTVGRVDHVPPGYWNILKDTLFCPPFVDTLGKWTGEPVAAGADIAGAKDINIYYSIPSEQKGSRKRFCAQEHHAELVWDALVASTMVYRASKGLWGGDKQGEGGWVVMGHLLKRSRLFSTSLESAEFRLGSIFSSAGRLGVKQNAYIGELLRRAALLVLVWPPPAVLPPLSGKDTLMKGVWRSASSRGSCKDWGCTLENIRDVGAGGLEVGRVCFEDLMQVDAEKYGVCASALLLLLSLGQQCKKGLGLPLISSLFSLVARQGNPVTLGTAKGRRVEPDAHIVACLRSNLALLTVLVKLEDCFEGKVLPLLKGMIDLVSWGGGETEDLWAGTIPDHVPWSWQDASIECLVCDFDTRAAYLTALLSFLTREKCDVSSAVVCVKSVLQVLDTTLDEYSVRRERRITGSMNILRLNHLWAFLSVLKESARTVSSVLQRFSGGHDELAATRDGCFEAIRKLVSATEPPQEVMQVDKENRILGDLGLLLESTEGKTPRRLDQPGQPQVQDSQEDDVDDEMIDLLNEMEDAAQCDEKAKPRGLQTERNDSPDHARSASDEKCVSEDDDTLLIQLLDEMEKNLAS